MSIPRDVGQLLIQKLDLGAVTPTEAKQHAKRYGVELVGRTRADVVRAICKNLTPTAKGAQ